MTADYHGAIGRGEVWVAVRAGRVAGFVVLVRRADHLLLENHGYVETHRENDEGFARVFFRKRLDRAG